MKRAVILHAIEETSGSHWYPWLKHALEARGYEVWVPDLPHPARPNSREMTAFLLANAAWNWDENLIIGHSSGAVEVLHLLQNMPAHTKAHMAVLIGAFDHILWQGKHEGLFEEAFKFNKIKAAADHFLLMHGSDDPWCPLEGARHLAAETGGELVVVEGGKHFSTSLDPSYTTFPALIELLEARNYI